MQCSPSLVVERFYGVSRVIGVKIAIPLHPSEYSVDRMSAILLPQRALSTAVRIHPLATMPPEAARSRLSLRVTPVRIKGNPRF